MPAELSLPASLPPNDGVRDRDRVLPAMRSLAAKLNDGGGERRFGENVSASSVSASVSDVNGVCIAGTGRSRSFFNAPSPPPSPSSLLLPSPPSLFAAPRLRLALDD